MGWLGRVNGRFEIFISYERHTIHAYMKSNILHMWVYYIEYKKYVVCDAVNGHLGSVGVYSEDNLGYLKLLQFCKHKLDVL